MRRHTLLLVVLVSFREFILFFLAFVGIKFIHLRLVGFRFFVQINKQVMALLGTGLHEGFVEFIFAGIIELVHSFAESFLISFFLAVIDHGGHELSHIGRLGTWGRSLRKNGFANLVEISYIVLAPFG